jgi:hypothetical protein
MLPYILAVTTRPVSGRAAEFDRWYEEIHIPEVLAVPGFATGRWYRHAAPAEEPGYLAVFEIETDDLQCTLAALDAARATMTTTDAIDSAATDVTVYEVLGEHRVAEDGGVDGQR